MRTRALLLAGLLLSGCVGERLSKRYERLLENKTINGRVVVTVSDQAVPSAGARARGLDLAPEAQAALVASLTRLGAKASDVIRELATSQSLDGPAGAYTDATRIKRRLVLTMGYPTDTWRRRDADRIQWLQLEIKLPDRRAAFASWDKVMTDYATVDLGSVDRTASTEFGVEIAPGTGALNGGAANLTLSEEVSESLALEQRIMKLSGALAPNTATLVQEGAPDRDLTGNLVLDVDLHFDAAKTETLFRVGALTEAGRDVPPGQVVISSVMVRRPDLSRPLCADVTASYAIRTVGKGRKTRGEYDDHVTMVEGVSTKSFDLAADLVPERYVFKFGPDGQELAWLENGASRSSGLFFEDRAIGTAMLRWLLRNPAARLKNGTLWDPGAGTKGAAVTPGQIANLFLEPQSPREPGCKPVEPADPTVNGLAATGTRK